MLRAIHVENFSSFADSGRIELADLNVFIGPNSAGKSNLMTVIELALRGIPSKSQQPLALDDFPSFASFDSVVRNGAAKGKRSTEFSMTFESRSWAGSKRRLWEYTFRRSPATGAALVHRAAYGWQGSPATTVVEAKDVDGKEYRAVAPARAKDRNATFAGGVVIVRWEGTTGRDNTAFLGEFESIGDRARTIVVRPHRPIPRSVYVLDDPLINAEERQLFKDLLRIWSEKEQKAVRERILQSLKTMTLASEIEVRTVGRGQGMVEVRVKPQGKGRAVTLADVGYGVSQVLPLLLQDAQDESRPASETSDLVVYQPEAHLHPVAQSRLADVFVASVRRGNRAYIETHSEHLVLRLQALIAGGEIEPDRVRVFCVEHDGKKSDVYPMLFDERGVPKTPWPKGFLDTGLELARDLAQRRQSRPPAKKRDG